PLTPSEASPSAPPPGSSPVVPPRCVRIPPPRSAPRPPAGVFRARTPLSPVHRVNQRPFQARSARPGTARTTTGSRTGVTASAGERPEPLGGLTRTAHGTPGSANRPCATRGAAAPDRALFADTAFQPRRNGNSVGGGLAAPSQRLSKPSANRKGPR